MAITFRAKADTNEYTTDKTLVVNKPTGTVEGDLMVAAIAYGAADPGAMTPPADWTPIRETANGTTLFLKTYYKIAGASEPASYTWTSANNVTAKVGAICTYYNIDGTPFDVDSYQANASSTNITAPGLTAAEDNELLVFAGAINIGTSSTTFTPPGGMTERVDVHSTYYCSLEMADAIQASAGASGDKVATAGSAGINIGHLAAFKELSATFKLSGVTDPAKISGVTASGIAKVTGVAPS